jgi:hypothetical protein
MIGKGGSSKWKKKRRKKMGIEPKDEWTCFTM